MYDLACYLWVGGAGKGQDRGGLSHLSFIQQLQKDYKGYVNLTKLFFLIM